MWKWGKAARARLPSCLRKPILHFMEEFFACVRIVFKPKIDKKVTVAAT